MCNTSLSSFLFLSSHYLRVHSACFPMHFKKSCSTRSKASHGLVLQFSCCHGQEDESKDPNVGTHLFISHCRMELSHNMEYYLVVPTMLFGRHVVPYLIVFSFLLFRLHVACYIGLSWYSISGVFYLVCFVWSSQNRSSTQFSVRVPESSRLQIVCFLCETMSRIPHFHLEIVRRQAFIVVTIQAAVFSGILYHFFHAKWLLLLPLPTMFGRVYYGAHWIGDTIGGIAIGFWVSLFLTPFIFRAVEMILGDYLPQSLLHLCYVCFHHLLILLSPRTKEHQVVVVAPVFQLRLPLHGHFVLIAMLCTH